MFFKNSGKNKEFWGEYFLRKESVMNVISPTITSLPRYIYLDILIHTKTIFS